MDRNIKHAHPSKDAATYLNRLYALLDVHDLGWVRNVPVDMLAYDARSRRDKLKIKNNVSLSDIMQNYV